MRVLSKRASGGHHPQCRFSIHRRTGNTFVDVGLAVDLIRNWFSPERSLGDTEDIFRHRITALKRILAQAIIFEALIKSLVTIPFDRFGAIGDNAPRGKVNAFEVALADLFGRRSCTRN